DRERQHFGAGLDRDDNGLAGQGVGQRLALRDMFEALGLAGAGQVDARIGVGVDDDGLVRDVGGWLCRNRTGGHPRRLARNSSTSSSLTPSMPPRAGPGRDAMSASVLASAAAWVSRRPAALHSSGTATPVTRALRTRTTCPRSPRMAS